MDILTLAGYYSLTPDGFEGAVADVLDRLGWSTMQVVGATRDLGLDVLAHDPFGHVAAIQCKRRLPGSSVGSSVVQSTCTRNFCRMPQGVSSSLASNALARFQMPGAVLASRRSSISK